MHFEVSGEQRERTEAIAVDGKSWMKHARRARVILLTEDGLGTMAIAAGTRPHPHLRPDPKCRKTNSCLRLRPRGIELETTS